MSKIEDRLTTVAANLDDLQSGLEAGSRAAGSIEKDADRINRLLEDQMRAADLAGTLMRRTRELRRCLQDQRAALKALRSNMRQLRKDPARTR